MLLAVSLYIPQLTMVVENAQVSLVPLYDKTNMNGLLTRLVALKFVLKKEY